jgi:capsid protein
MSAKQPISLSMRQRIAAAFQGISAAVTGQWEGGQQSRYRDRPQQRLVAQDTDLDFGNREKMMSEARSLSQTFPIIRRILRTYSTYCVGNLRVQWRTGNPEIDRRYESAWMSTMDTIDARGQHHFTKLAKISLSRMLCDGDVFAQKIDSAGIGQLGIVEADRVTNSGGGSLGADKKDLIGGIRIDGNGRPIAYRICKRTPYGSFEDPVELSASDGLHVWDTDRADSYRGVTAFASVLNAMRDLKEILHAETIGVKANSKLALIVKSLSGGVSTGAGDVELFDNGSTSQSASTQVNAQEISDGVMQYMFPGEDIHAHSSDKPSAAWQGFVDWLVGMVAIGLDLPKSVVWSMSGLGGAAARFEIQAAGRTFASVQDILERKLLVPVAAWTTAKQIKSGRLPFHPNWSQFKFQRPPFVSVDLGRDSKSGIEENLSGMLTAQEWFAESGQDFFEETEQLAKEASFRMEMAAKYKVPIGSIRQTTPNGNPVDQVEPKEPDTDDETRTT